MCYVLTKVLSLSQKNERYVIYSIDKYRQQRSLHQPEQGCRFHKKWKRYESSLPQCADIGC